MRLDKIRQTEGEWIALLEPPWWEWQPTLPPPRKGGRPPKTPPEVDRWGRPLTSHTGRRIAPKKRGEK